MSHRLWKIPIVLLVAAACAHTPDPPGAPPSLHLEPLAEQVVIFADSAADYARFLSE